MLGSLIAALVTHTKLSALIGVSVLVGAAAGAGVGASHRADTVTVTTVAGSQAHGHDAASGVNANAHRTAKPVPAAAGTHGACVAVVARDHNAVGGPHHNHGGAVSAAAHSCPKPGEAGANGTSHQKKPKADNGAKSKSDDKGKADNKDESTSHESGEPSGS